MNAIQVLDHFDRICDAPNAIPRLRRFILDLAVRGKLVEQESNDEPASELLKRIHAEKARLVKERTIRKQEPTLPIEIGDHQFELPRTWEWVRFGTIAGFSAGRTPSRHDFSYWNTGDYPWVSIADMTDGGVVITTKETVSKKAKEHLFRSEPAPVGTLIMSFKLTIGKISRLGVPAFHNEAIISIHPHLAAMDAYLFMVLPRFSQLGDTKDAIKGATLNRESITNIVLPLPPLAEQHRIVAKVHELMELCDRLEAAQTERESRRGKMAAASLHRLNNGADADEFRKHARFHLRHLPRLTTRPEHIRELRQTILNLAVRGKLVPQDPNDEPASELLARIQAEKARLEKDGKIKKERNLDAVNTDAAPSAIPESWRWVRLGELTELITKGSSPKWQGVEYVSKDFGVLFITSENVGNYRLRKLDDLKYVEKQFNEIEPRSILCFGDILMNLVGASIGRTAIYDLDEEANINQAVALVRLLPGVTNVSPEYLLHYLNSPSAVEFMTSSQVVTAQPNISLTNAREFPIPIPPLAEQRRIVAKVDELMSLCDRLEAQLTATQTESRRLLDAVLQDVLNNVA